MRQLEKFKNFIEYFVINQYIQYSLVKNSAIKVFQPKETNLANETMCDILKAIANSNLSQKDLDKIIQDNKQDLDKIINKIDTLFFLDLAVTFRYMSNNEKSGEVVKNYFYILKEILQPDEYEDLLSRTFAKLFIFKKTEENFDLGYQETLKTPIMLAFNDGNLVDILKRFEKNNQEENTFEVLNVSRSFIKTVCDFYEVMNEKKLLDAVVERKSVKRIVKL